jgi:hypothetical protein
MTSTKEYPYTLADGRVVKEYKREEGTKYLYLISCSECGDESWGRPSRLSRECIACRGYVVKHPDEETRQLHLTYRNIKNSARQRGHEFTLTKEEFMWLMDRDCFWCGDKPSGIDRMNNTQGYTMNNAVPSCKRCNVAKNDMTMTEWSEWLARITKMWGINNG